MLLKALKKLALLACLSLPLLGQVAVDPSTKVRNCLNFTGANFGAKALAAIGNGPATGVVADCRGILTTLTSSANFSTVTTPTTLVFPSKTISFTADTTFSSAITLKLEQGAILCPDTTKTLTINGPVDADISQHFCTGAGRVVLNGNRYAEWWGAQGAGGDDYLAFQAMANSFPANGGILTLQPEKDYLVSRGAVFSTPFTVVGNHAIWRWSAASTGGTVVPGICDPTACDALILAYNGATRSITAGVPAATAGVISGIKIQGVHFKGFCNVGDAHVPKTQPLILVGVKDVEISGNTFENGCSEQIFSDAYFGYARIHDNVYINNNHDGIAPVVTDTVDIHNNQFINTYQPLETSGYRVRIHNNQIYRSGAGTGIAIWVSNTTLGINMDVEVKNNTVSGGYQVAVNLSDEYTEATSTADIFSSTTIGRSTLTMAINAYVGYPVTITSGTGSGQTRLVVSNTATTFTVSTWTTTPDGTSVFRISGKPVNFKRQIVTGNTLAPCLSVSQNFVNVIASSVGEWDISDNTMDDSCVSVNTGTMISVTGASTGLKGRIHGNKALLSTNYMTSLAQVPSGNVTPVEYSDNSVTGSGTFREVWNDPSSGKIYKSMFRMGSADAAISKLRDNDYKGQGRTYIDVVNLYTADIFSSTTIGYTGLTMVVNAFAGQNVSIVRGTGLGQAKTIISNTATTFTTTAWGVTPDGTSVFTLSSPSDTTLQIGDANLVRVQGFCRTFSQFFAQAPFQVRNECGAASILQLAYGASTFLVPGSQNVQVAVNDASDWWYPANAAGSIMQQARWAMAVPASWNTGTIATSTDLQGRGVMIQAHGGGLNAKVGYYAQFSNSPGIPAGVVLGRSGANLGTYVGFHAHPDDGSTTDAMPEVGRIDTTFMNIPALKISSNTAIDSSRNFTGGTASLGGALSFTGTAGTDQRINMGGVRSIERLASGALELATNVSDILLNPTSTFVGVNNSSPAYAFDTTGTINASAGYRVAGNNTIDSARNFFGLSYNKTDGTTYISSSSVLANVTANTNILTSGTLGLARAGLGVDGTSITANFGFFGPTSGGAGNATFRALVIADIPALPTSKITSGTFDVARIPIMDHTAQGCTAAAYTATATNAAGTGTCTIIFDSCGHRTGGTC